MVKNLNIALDARIAHYNRSGISRFVRGLLGGFGELPPGISLTVYQSVRDRRPIASGRNVSTKYLFTPPHSSWEPATLPLELRKGRHTFVHTLDFFASAGRGQPLIAQIYDLHFLREPGSLDRRSFRHYSRLKKIKSQVAHYICSSAATKKDVIELLEIRPENTSVIYPGFTPLAPIDSNTVETVKVKFGITAGFILSVGTIEPRKNLVRLFTAYKNSRERIGVRMPQLILAGRKGYQAGEILGSIRELGIENYVRYLGEVSDVELRALYASAGVVSYASLYEGFGFPLLEAMSAGVPVLASNVSSMPEIAGAAAHYVDPLEVEDISRGLEALIFDANLRERLEAQRSEILGRYTWSDCAERTLAVYQQAEAAVGF